MITKMSGILRRCRVALRELGGSDGNTAVEFGLFLPIIMLILLGSVELGRYGVEMNRVTNAARAGLQYAMQGQGYAKATDFIIAAVREDAGDTTNTLTVTSRWFCRCSGSTSEIPCNDQCVDEDTYAQMYVQVAVSETFPALFPLLSATPSFSLPVSFKPSVVSTARVR